MDVLGDYLPIYLPYSTLLYPNKLRVYEVNCPIIYLLCISDVKHYSLLPFTT